MEQYTVETTSNASFSFLAGGGEMGQRIREYDWSTTSVGPIGTWPQSLRTCIRILLASRQPMWLGWGTDLNKFYNDPYIAITGGKHPWALGKPVSLVWNEIWNDIGEPLKKVMEDDDGFYTESQLLIMERNGYPEETYFTFSYTPIPGDSGATEGMICANTEETNRIITERQLKTLTKLGKSLTNLKSNTAVIDKLIACLGENPRDFPFSAFYTFKGNEATLSRTTEMGTAAGKLPNMVTIGDNTEFGQIFKRTVEGKAIEVVQYLTELLGEMPRGPWNVPPNKAIVLPVTHPSLQEPYGFWIVGLNPYRLLDDMYSSFFSLIADQIATSISGVHIIEAERKRAEALAEIDRAKTTFFSNISHEFRTPLTLMLGPVEDALNEPGCTPLNKIRMDLAYRNGLRLQKLVNNLLEFSRIEAGRLDGHFSEVDIIGFTQDLTSLFRSAVEKAGMELHFDHSPIALPVFVDTGMWEKIVLNLLSNAFKYSDDGHIDVNISQNNNTIQLTVRDTGIGIPPDQLDRIFDRFHRIENTKGRSQEGTGIGLALVKELVKLHNGTIEVTSAVDVGSTFVVTIPCGTEHLTRNKVEPILVVAKPSQSTKAYIEEALKWLPHSDAASSLHIQSKNEVEHPKLEGEIQKKIVLVADDNADMREYIARLLDDQFEIITKSNGEDAYAAALAIKPDLIISDIMMPVLDGFGLLQKIRSNFELKNTPVIFLSARAGDEAKVEGLEAGADDYMVKPFSARELIARVETNLKINSARLSAEKELYSFFIQAPIGIVVLSGPDYLIEIANDYYEPIVARKKEDLIGYSIFETMPPEADNSFRALLDKVRASGKTITRRETKATIIRNGTPNMVYLDIYYQPIKRYNGVVDKIMMVVQDVSQQVIARETIAESQKELEEMANAMPQLVWVADGAGEVTYYNNRVAEFSGARRTDDGKWIWNGLIHPDDYPLTQTAWETALLNGTHYQAEHRMQMHNGEYKWHLSRGIPLKGEAGNVIKWFGTATDIHFAKAQSEILEEEVKRRTLELNRTNQSLQMSNTDLQQFAHVASHDLKEPTRKIKIFISRLKEEDNILTPKSVTFIEKMEKASDRMLAMIEGVLSYSTINASRQPIQLVMLDNVFEDIISDLEIMMVQKGAKVIAQPAPTIEGAEILIYQLFYNLIINSLKFARVGVAPVIEVTNKVIEIAERGWVVLSLTDNGIGFNQYEAAKIFETFARLHTKEKYEGTGLGLALCKKIVERHNGTIEAKSVVGVGSTFIITLPLIQLQEHI